MILLGEAEEAPWFDITLQPPKISLDAPGLYASVYMVFGAADAKPALAESGWSIEVDISPWLDKIKDLPLLDEAVGGEAHTIERWFGGFVKTQPGPVKVRLQMDVKDAFITTGYTLGVGFTMLYTVYQVRWRPSL